MDLVVSGMHMHIGSGTDIEHLAQVCGAMEKACIEVGRTVTTISAGGGSAGAIQEESNLRRSCEVLRTVECNA